MTKRNVVVIGGCAGGVEAPFHLVSRLLPDSASAVGVFAHMSPVDTAVPARVRNRLGSLPAIHGETVWAPQPGWIQGAQLRVA